MPAWLSAATIVTLCSLIGTALSALTSAPQLTRLRRTHNVAGVSATTSALTVVSGLSWGAYGWAHHLPLLLASSVCTVLLVTPITLMLASAGAWSVPSRIVCSAILLLYITVTVLLGWTALGFLLGMHTLIQYTPQTVAVLRSDDIAGVSPASAAIRLANGVIWGTVGVFAGDVPLMAWAVIVLTSATIILVRVTDGRTWFSRVTAYRWGA